MNVLHLGPPDAFEAIKVRKLLGVWDTCNRKELTGADLEWADYIVSYRYRYYVPDIITEMFYGRAINVHAGLVQEVRGVRPVFFALWYGHRLGWTIHSLAQGYDRGPVIMQGLVEQAKPEESLEQVWQRVNDAALDHLAGFWGRIIQGTVSYTAEHGKLYTIEEFAPLFARLPKGWKTTVKELKEVQHAPEPGSTDSGA